MQPLPLDKTLHHTITVSSRLGVRPFHVQCSCGTAGDFTDKQSANSYASFHAGRLGGINTVEVVDKCGAPAPTGAQPEKPKEEKVEAPAPKPESVAAVRG